MANNPLHSSQSNEWYTPRRFVILARSVMGTIDLDPASCQSANNTVMALRYYTKEQDGYVQPWHGNVWLNPPYGKTGNKSNQDLWVTKLLHEYISGNVEQACCLVNSCTGDRWFQRLWQYPICFVESRIRFLSPSGVKSQPTHSSVVFYLGGDDGQAKFARVFSVTGHVVLPRQLQQLRFVK